jgi:hypothetical protein
MLIVWVKVVRGDRVYLLLLIEQEVPVKDAEQVLVPVRIDGRVRVSASS